MNLIEFMMPGSGMYPWFETEPAPADPLSDPDILLWYDSKTLSNLYTTSAKAANVAANDDPVGAWTDRAYGVDLLQATAGRRPLYKAAYDNGIPYILFDGVDDYLRTTIGLVAQPVTVYSVQKYVSLVAAGKVYDGAGLATQRMQLLNIAGGGRQINAGTARAAGNWDTNAHLACVQFNGASSKCFIDEAQVGTTGDAGAQSLSGLTVGAERLATPAVYGSLAVACVMAFQGVHDATAIASYSVYLRGRYGLTY